MTNYHALTKRAFQLIRAGKTAEALTMAQGLPAVTPKDYNAWFMSAYLTTAYGDQNQALKIIAKALEKFPKRTALVGLRYAAMLNAGQTPDALQEMQAKDFIMKKSQYGYHALLELRLGFLAASMGLGSVIRKVRKNVRIATGVDVDDALYARLMSRRTEMASGRSLYEMGGEAIDGAARRVTAPAPALPQVA